MILYSSLHRYLCKLVQVIRRMLNNNVRQDFPFVIALVSGPLARKGTRGRKMREVEEGSPPLCIMTGYGRGALKGP